MLSLIIIVSTTKRRRDIKILLRLSAPMQQSLIQQVLTMDARISAIFPFATANTLFEQI